MANRFVSSAFRISRGFLSSRQVLARTTARLSTSALRCLPSTATKQTLASRTSRLIRKRRPLTAYCEASGPHNLEIVTVSLSEKLDLGAIYRDEKMGMVYHPTFVDAASRQTVVEIDCLNASFQGVKPVAFAVSQTTVYVPLNKLIRRSSSHYPPREVHHRGERHPRLLCILRRRCRLLERRRERTLSNSKALGTSLRRRILGQPRLRRNGFDAVRTHRQRQKSDLPRRCFVESGPSRIEPAEPHFHTGTLRLFPRIRRFCEARDLGIAAERFRRTACGDDEGNDTRKDALEQEEGNAEDGRIRSAAALDQPEHVPPERRFLLGAAGA
ncbi:hypothetical protein L596_009290 [Steinernema carpocapsae]|uniref:Uncharacterized protein n=1 Tax=Steinernema carpocapsae TaxID=34508 RepID=A0A4U5PG74_STECR|nr:hypothetical protein L596_009290 [Steinernema carpocapsae]